MHAASTQQENAESTPRCSSYRTKQADRTPGTCTSKALPIIKLCSPRRVRSTGLKHSLFAMPRRSLRGGDSSRASSLPSLKASLPAATAAAWSGQRASRAVKEVGFEGASVFLSCPPCTTRGTHLSSLPHSRPCARCLQALRSSVHTQVSTRSADLEQGLRLGPCGHATAE